MHYPPLYNVQQLNRTSKCKRNVNVHVYNPEILMSSTDCTIYIPGIGAHSVIASTPLGRIQHILCSKSQSLQVGIFHSARYPLLLGGQRQHGMRSLPDTSTQDSSGNWTPDPLSLSQSTMPYPLDPHNPKSYTCNYISNNDSHICLIFHVK